MTVEQLAAQCLMPGILSDTLPATLQQLDRYSGMGAGGVVLLRGTSVQAAALANRLRSHSTVMPFVAVDAEWGLGMRFSDIAPEPVPSRLAAAHTDMYACGRSTAAQCRTLGINMVLGPVADLTGRGIDRARCYSPDAAVVSDMACGYIAGLRSGGVMAVAKHFPGHGHALADSHRRLAVVPMDSASFCKNDLSPFADAIRNGLSAIMAGHIAVPSLDRSRRPASVSPFMLDTLLRRRLGFEGLILTDAINMAGAKGWTAADALLAGADLVLVPPDVEAARSGIVSRMSGPQGAATLRDRVRRILFYKYLLGN